MEIGSEQCIKILQANFDFDTIDTPLGSGVIIPAKEAFIFTTVTGAGYLDNPLYQFTPKGLMKLFYNAFEYKFVSGLFENTILKHTPYNLSTAKPFLFAGPKYVIPIEIETELKFQGQLKALFSNLTNPTDYIILRIEKSKKGNGMEGFMEYLVSEFFKKQGYIVENQIPLAHAIGSPDFGGYKLATIFHALGKYGILSNIGFHIIELSLIRLFDSFTNASNIQLSNSAIVGEAKTSTNSMKKQLNKYLNTGLFEFGIEIHPYKHKPSIEEFALFNINPLSYKLNYTPPKQKIEYPEVFSKSDYYNWLEDYMKFHLIANLTNDELTELYQITQSEYKFNQVDLIHFVRSISIENLLSYISQQTLHNGAIK